ncbi:unnamed protein product [Symbiodinium sp. CCMP2592]|nr:unnamed protein product [Symbiodinium sp. CCMP2592]
MPLKLYAAASDYKTKKVLIAAQYVGMEVSCPEQGKAIEGKIPVLETEKGCIFTSGAIARYVARISRPVGLYGQNLLEALNWDASGPCSIFGTSCMIPDPDGRAHFQKQIVAGSSGTALHLGPPDDGQVSRSAGSHSLPEP